MIYVTDDDLMEGVSTTFNFQNLNKKIINDATYTVGNTYFIFGDVLLAPPG